MATNAPCEPCFVCGGKLEWEVVEQHHQPWEPPRFGPTEWRQLPHTCPPGAVEAWVERVFDRSPRKPFFVTLSPPRTASAFEREEVAMAIRCKMRLDNVFRQRWGGIKAFFSCQYDEKLAKEDASFQKATPTGNAEFVIDNPKAAEQLTIGEYYYVDFHPVPKPEAASV